MYSYVKDSSLTDLPKKFYAAYTKVFYLIKTDRFFGPDYYDSPHEPHLAEAARKFLLDYTPDYTEGLGHRVIVTTAWQDEVLRRLRATMGEIVARLREVWGRYVETPAF